MEEPQPEPIEDTYSRAERRRKPDTRTSTKLVSRKVYRACKSPIAFLGKKQFFKKLNKMSVEQIQLFYARLVQMRKETKEMTAYDKVQEMCNTCMDVMQAKEISVEDINKITQQNQ